MLERDTGYILLASIVSLVSSGCTVEKYETKDLINDPFVDQQAEIREVVMSIKADIEAAWSVRVDMCNVAATESSVVFPSGN